MPFDLVAGTTIIGIHRRVWWGGYQRTTITAPPLTLLPLLPENHLALAPTEYHIDLSSLSWRILLTKSAPCSGGLLYIGRATAFIWLSTATASCQESEGEELKFRQGSVDV